MSSCSFITTSNSPTSDLDGYSSEEELIHIQHSIHSPTITDSGNPTSNLSGYIFSPTPLPAGSPELTLTQFLHRSDTPGPMQPPSQRFLTPHTFTPDPHEVKVETLSEKSDSEEEIYWNDLRKIGKQEDRKQLFIQILEKLPRTIVELENLGKKVPSLEKLIDEMIRCMSETAKENEDLDVEDFIWQLTMKFLTNEMIHHDSSHLEMMILSAPDQSMKMLEKIILIKPDSVAGTLELLQDSNGKQSPLSNAICEQICIRLRDEGSFDPQSVEKTIRETAQESLRKIHKSAQESIETIHRTVLEHLKTTPKDLKQHLKCLILEMELPRTIGELKEELFQLESLAPSIFTAPFRGKLLSKVETFIAKNHPSFPCKSEDAHLLNPFMRAKQTLLNQVAQERSPWSESLGGQWRSQRSVREMRETPRQF